jgi:hypothetical protein
LPGCGNPIKRGETMSRAQWLGMRYCSTSCANRSRRADLCAGPRYCPICEKELVQRQDERNSAFRARKTCGGECFSAFMDAFNKSRAVHQAEQLPTPAEIAAMFAAIGRDYSADNCPIAKDDCGSFGYGWRNVMNHSAYGSSADMCVNGATRSALRF